MFSHEAFLDFAAVFILVLAFITVGIPLIGVIFSDWRKKKTYIDAMINGLDIVTRVVIALGTTVILIWSTQRVELLLS